MAPFETLHWAHAGAGGVAMDAGNKAEIIVTPLQKNTDNSILHVGTPQRIPQGAVSGSLKMAFIGQRAIELRQLGIKSGRRSGESGDQRNGRAAGAGRVSRRQLIMSSISMIPTSSCWR